MAYYIYVLQSERDGRLYIGQTKNLAARITAHNAGKVKSTRHRKPFELIHHEVFDTREQAIERERQLKSIVCRDFKRQLKRARAGDKAFYS